MKKKSLVGWIEKFEFECIDADSGRIQNERLPNYLWYRKKFLNEPVKVRITIEEMG